MKIKAAICTFFLLFSFLLFSQQTQRPPLPSDAKKAPRRVAENMYDLTEYLTKNSSTETEKAAAIFTWIANNIKYDVKALRKNKIKYYTPEETLTTKKGVCMHYSELFAEMCNIAGIKAFVVHGYAKGFGYRKTEPFIRANHAWNMVRLENEWFLVDPTWGSGYVWYVDVLSKKQTKTISHKLRFFRHVQEKYFMSDPKEMAESHFPWTAEYQLLEDPITIEEFEKDSILEFSENRNFNYKNMIEEDAILNQKEFEILKGFNSKIYNGKNNFDRAVSIILENSEKNTIEDFSEDKEQEYNSFIRTFDEAIHYLEEHREVLKWAHKKRLKEISYVKSLAVRASQKIKSDNPTNGKRPSKYTENFKKQIMNYGDSNERISEALGKVQEYFYEYKSKSELDFQGNENWDTLVMKNKEYEELLQKYQSHFDSLMFQKMIVADKMYEGEGLMAGMINDYDVSITENEFLEKLSILKKMKEEQRAIRKSISNTGKKVSEKYSILRKEFSEKRRRYKQLIRKVKKNDSLDKEKIEKEYSRTCHNLMAIYKSKIHSNQLKINYNKIRIDQIFRLFGYYKKIMKDRKKFDKETDRYNTALLNIENDKHANEIATRIKWKSEASKEKNMYKGFLKRIERMEIQASKNVFPSVQ